MFVGHENFDFHFGCECPHQSRFFRLSTIIQTKKLQRYDHFDMKTKLQQFRVTFM